MRSSDESNPTKEKGPGLSDIEWARIEDLTEHRKAGLYSGLWYLLDEDENAVSDGYHSLKKDGYGFEGTIGGKRSYIEPHDQSLRRE